MSENNFEKAAVPAFLDEDQALAYVQGIQLAVVREATAKGYIPEDSDNKKILMQALDGLSRNALTQKRIKSDEAAAAGLAASGAGIIAELLKQVSHRYGGNNANNTTVIIEAPVLGSDIPPPILLPGEVEQGTVHLSYDEFITTMKR